MKCAFRWFILQYIYIIIYLYYNIFILQYIYITIYLYYNIFILQYIYITLHGAKNTKLILLCAWET